MTTEKEKVTEGGFRYEYYGDHLIRDSFKPYRLKEDDETYEEYKIRQKLIQVADKRRKKGQGRWIWLSKNPKDMMGGDASTSWGPKTKEKVEQLKQYYEGSDQHKSE